MQPIEDYKKSGTTGERRSLQGRDPTKQAIADLLRQARREILIFSPHLEGFLFNTTEVAHALADFAAHHRHNQAHILVENGQRTIHDNPRIIELCRRFSDFIQLRQVGEHLLGGREMFLVVDQLTILQQPDVDSPLWLITPASRLEAAKLKKHFDGHWQHAVILPEINTTGL
jgi:hypothetical protein